MGSGSWAQHFAEISKHPGAFIQGHWIWIIALFFVLFLLSRLNNYMEVNGVNKAIYFTRGVVGTIIAFVIAPIAFILLLNGYALLNGLPLINLSFLWDWLKLTGTTFYWLLKCIGMPRGEVMFDTNSLVRILWILLPVSFIWLRVASNNFWRLMLIPFCIALLSLTAYKKAQPTFLNAYIPVEWQEFRVGDKSSPVRSLEEKIKDLEEKAANQDPGSKKKSFIASRGEEISGEAENLYRKNFKLITAGVFGMFLFSIGIGYFTKFKMAALLLASGCIGSFFFMMRSSADVNEYQTRTTFETPFHTLTDQFEREYKAHGESVSAYEISLKIRDKVASGKNNLPKDYCILYKLYFYDLCAEAEPSPEFNAGNSGPSGK